MEEINAHITQINKKVKLLLTNHALLQKENELKSKTIEILEQQQIQLDDQLKNLVQQNNILKAALGKMEDGDKKTFERSITKYIKDIDKCINLLEQ